MTEEIESSHEKDYSLEGEDLTRRVQEILKQMGFNVEKGRPGKEDLIIRKPSPVVIEVKSRRNKEGILYEHLRQLDDRIFELSGEEEARKGNVPVFKPTWSYGKSVIGGSSFNHPKPHKGVLIFNGPTSIPFHARSGSCLPPNQKDFVEKRRLCIIPFATLIKYYERYKEDASASDTLWGKMLSTVRVLD